MSKTKETIDLEDALDAASERKREYGCREVTIGFHHEGHGDEIVDYITMDARSIFKCYELKVSLGDLKSDNKKSFYGDYNYLVVSESLYMRHPSFDNWIPPYCGILCGTDLKTVRPAKKRTIDEKTREMLKDSLIRTLYWKMKSYQDADNLAASRQLQKQLDEEKKSLEEKLHQAERKEWTYDDYEYYYQCNHQDPSFRIEKAAKEERRQYLLRKENRLVNGNVCPNCGHAIESGDCWCSSCGMDLRRIKLE